jgi:DNA-binding transcriptional ArsR family regulator
MRNVQISLVGMQSEGARAALKVPPPVDYVVLLHSDAPQSVRAAKEVSMVTAKLPGTTCALKVIDPFGMNDILSKIIEVRKEVGDASKAHVTVVVSGGTNVMAGAAFLGCLLIDAEAVYIKEDVTAKKDQPLADRVLRFPIPRIPPERLSEPLREVLRVMPRGQDAVVTKAPTFLRDRLGLSPQTASYRLKKLAELKFVNYRPEGRNRLASLTDSGRLFAALLSEI